MSRGPELIGLLLMQGKPSTAYATDKARSLIIKINIHKCYQMSNASNKDILQSA